jgi:hypothetical protein
VTPRDRTVLVVVAMLAVVGGFWFAALGPRRQEASKLDQQITQARADRDSAVQAAATARTAQREYASDYATVARLGKAVPSDDGTASLVYQLEAASGSSRVNFQSVKLGGASGAPAGNAQSATPASTTSSTQAAAAPLPPGAVVGPAGLSKLPFSLTFQGTYFELERLLRRVHAFTSVQGDVIRVDGRLLTVDGLALKVAQSGFPQITASLTASAYLAPLPKLPAPAPAASGTGGAVPTQPSGGASPAPTTAATAIGVGG